MSAQPAHAVSADSPAAAADDRLLRAMERLTAALENLSNQLAALRRGDAHGVTMTATLLDAAEFAAILSADARTVRRWVREGEVPPPLRIGGSLRWKRSAIDAWLEAKQ